MRRFTMFLFSLLSLLMLQPVLAQSNSWTAEYFNNPSLAGAPVAVLNEQSPGREWGYNAPVAGVPADNFSARWSTNAYLTAGTYQISVKVDDGVRVLVDGVATINQWQFAAGNFYQGAVTVAEGNHSIVVEYFEGGEVAYLNYNFDRLPDPFGGPRATVTAQFLNVRALPNASSSILDIISQGQTYPLVGRNAANSWLQLNINGTVGWVNARFMTTNDLFAVPITDGSGVIPTPVPPQPTGATAQVTANRLNVRNAPNPYSGAVIAQVSRNEIYSVVGRNLDTSWVQINVNGLIGWVRSSWTVLNNMAGVPVTDGSGPIPPPVGATAQVTAYRLNVRNAPNPYTGTVMTQVSRNEIYSVVGRNLDTSWVQVNVNGLIGWVRSSWTILSNIAGVPVTSNTNNPAPPAPTTTEATVRAYFLNVRSQPVFGAHILTIVARGWRYPVVGRNAASTWVQINVGGTIGWVRSSWVTVSPGLGGIPVTG